MKWVWALGGFFVGLVIWKYLQDPVLHWYMRYTLFSIFKLGGAGAAPLYRLVVQNMALYSALAFGVLGALGGLIFYFLIRWNEYP